ncbi:MAG: hypothetical protein HETSPECPRED_002205 [Heterodermia speciosa]|uniref:PNPLA domain-containing protein n=1 Tax=Heterodermia speciosa TaxID=116794 RepID=A0A8H3J3T5_9LECA|nr:MAG: hypothetical protein HETSPECPRED_002205 [Heterodermia speciosa]
MNPALDRNPSPAHDIPIWQVSRANSAAPTYFKQAKMNETHYLDGGFGEKNNPSGEIFDEVRVMNNQMQDPTSIFISIGIGRSNDMSRFSSGKSATSRLRKVITFAKKLPTNAEVMHRNMLQHQENFKLNCNRFDVEQGLDMMKPDEWRVRGKLRVKMRWQMPQFPHSKEAYFGIIQREGSTSQACQLQVQRRIRPFNLTRHASG